jgi:hypothetical protein
MTRHKYLSTRHVPFSPGRTKDDGVHRNLDFLVGKEVVTTIKKDGENTSLYADGFHARSLDSRHHPSRDWLAAYHSTIAHRIPAGWRICGENLYARHSIAYDALPSYFLAFSVWDENNWALSWDDTKAFLKEIEVHCVPEVPGAPRGVFNEEQLRKLAKTWDTEKDEGFVVRLASSFSYENFSQSVAKWVRAEHVQTDTHWMHSKIVPNGLAKRPSDPPTEILS